MESTENKKKNYYSQRDNEILKSSRVVEWLDTLEKEFALHHHRPKTRDSYRNAIKRFIIWKIKSGCMDDLDTSIRNYLTHLAQDTHIAASTQNVIFNALRFFVQRTAAAVWTVKQSCEDMHRILSGQGADVDLGRAMAICESFDKGDYVL